jgi:hypothetical protein
MRVAAKAGLVLLAASVGVGPAATPAIALQATAAEVTDPDQKIKCRKYLAPGSLVRKVKTCRTIAEWRKAAQAGNDAARYIVGENVCSGGDCRGYEPPDAPE